MQNILFIVFLLLCRPVQNQRITVLLPDSSSMLWKELFGLTASYVYCAPATATVPKYFIDPYPSMTFSALYFSW